MTGDLPTMIANWSPEQRQQALALLLEELRGPDVTDEQRETYWAKVRSRLAAGRRTVTPATFLREVDRMD